MINFILPNFYHNYIDMQNLIKEYSNSFYGIEGSYDFSIFNGRINNNKNSSFTYFNAIIESIEAYNIISENFIFIDFGNIALTNIDYFNTFGEVVLKELSEKSNVYFEIADIKFMQYLIEKYPNIKIILHENYTIFTPEEEIQKIINLYPNNIKGINITTLNLCSNINIGLKIGILNLNNCFSCLHFFSCLKSENNNTLNYRGASVFNGCEKKKILLMEKIEKKLKVLLNNTPNILFTGLTDNQIENYINTIKQILENNIKN